jgi:hypothetical protein
LRSMVTVPPIIRHLWPLIILLSIPSSIPIVVRVTMMLLRVLSISRREDFRVLHQRVTV